MNINLYLEVWVYIAGNAKPKSQNGTVLRSIMNKLIGNFRLCRDR